jgi:carboxymethylenebutenolidase
VPEWAPSTMKPLTGLAADLSCPLLGLFGAEDKFPAPEETAELSAELDRLGKEHEFHTLDGAGHGFFAVDRDSYRVQAATRGWELIWDFFGRHLAG